MALEEAVVRDRRHLHAHPELSFRERETVAYLRAQVEALGLSPQERGGGLVVDLAGGAGPGRTVAVRADMDALPVEEAEGLPFRSQAPGVMHACGHDAHMAIALGVLRRLVAGRDRLAGRVRFLFQPAEETPPGGALELIRAGALDGVEAIVGLHVNSLLPVGRAQVQSGPLLANSDVFEVEIEGVGGHGSQPHLTVDAALVAAQTVVHLQTVVSRRVDPLQPAVVSVGRIEAGTAHNIIPGRARVVGTVRTLSEGVRERVRAEMERIVRASADLAGASARLVYTEGYPAVVNPEGWPTTVLAETAAEVVGRAGVVQGPPWLAGEDFAYYQRHVPGAFFFLGCGGPDRAPHHSSAFALDEGCLVYGVDILARAAVRLAAGG
ncbi:MAG: amidohydrolase [Firmicutes bacterium]|nr:amidohydrolase [Bacillota bacterium]